MPSEDLLQPLFAATMMMREMQHSSTERLPSSTSTRSQDSAVEEVGVQPGSPWTSSLVHSGHSIAGIDC